uniref:Uncharacterized protein LOC113784780 n=1 Tax=Cicer arietinum TaxID=3827 RepID=A0A3Q7Y7A6_CICAR|nr:uncharacterized protein LOC113784780 [Cicer arietinum]
MWDILQQTHEGTTDVKRARINTLMHEYWMFNLKKEESVNDMQTRFTHIVNNRNVLGKVIDNVQQISKVRCLTREWQPKITAIAESKDLGHIKSECFQLQNRNKSSKAKGNQPPPKSRKAYIAWNDNDEESSASSADEEANLCLMTNTDSDSDSERMETDLESKETNGGFVKYGDNNKGKILGIGDIGNESTTVIKDVLYVKDLKHNLISISQLYDKGFQVSFTSQSCIIEHKENKDIRLVGNRINNIYMPDFNALPASSICCLLSNADENWLWHKRVAHIHMDHLNKLVSKQLVLGLPNRKFSKDRLCDSCEKSKLVKSSFPPIDLVQTNRVLQLVHMDLFGPPQVRSFGRNLYCYVLVDDYSREDDLPKEWKFNKNHPIDNIIGEISKGVTTRKTLRHFL